MSSRQNPKMMGGKSEEEKFELRLKLAKSGLVQGIRKTSRAFQCDRNTVRLWLRRYKEKGLPGLRERSNSPKRIPHKTPADLEEKVLEAREKAPLYGAKRLKESFSLAPSVGAIARILKQKGLTKKRIKNYPEKATLEEREDMPQALSREIYSDNPKQYKSLGSLLKDYRRWRKLNQEALAELIHVSVRELRNWETERCRAHIETLHDLAEFTGIPMEVCVILNAGQPIWYALTERWFAYSLTEMAEFRIKDLIQNPAPFNDGIIAKDDLITTDKQIDAILSCRRDIYGKKIPLGRDVIKAACRILPDLNRIVFDCWGHYVGHQICLPMAKGVYEQVKEEKSIEGYLGPESISDIVAAGEGVFLYYSMFEANASVLYPVIVKNIRFHAKIANKGRYLMGVYAVTKLQKEMCREAGMRVVMEREDDKQKHTIWYEVELDAVWKPAGFFDMALGLLVKENN